MVIDMVVNVIMRKRRKTETGCRYVTIAMAKHWSLGEDGFMVTTGTWDATKFDEGDRDAELFVNYLNSHATDEDVYEVVPIDVRHLSVTRNEYWSDSHVNCGFKDNKIFKGVCLIE